MTQENMGLEGPDELVDKIVERSAKVQAELKRLNPEEPPKPKRLMVDREHKCRGYIGNIK